MSKTTETLLAALDFINEEPTYWAIKPWDTDYILLAEQPSPMVPSETKCGWEPEDGWANVLWPWGWFGRMLGAAEMEEGYWYPIWLEVSHD